MNLGTTGSKILLLLPLGTPADSIGHCPVYIFPMVHYDYPNKASASLGSIIDQG